MNEKFITTSDAEVANQLIAAGYQILNNNNNLFVFMNNPTLTFAETNIDYKKIMFTNLMTI